MIGYITYYSQKKIFFYFSWSCCCTYSFSVIMVRVFNHVLIIHWNNVIDTTILYTSIKIIFIKKTNSTYIYAIYAAGCLCILSYYYLPILLWFIGDICSIKYVLIVVHYDIMHCIWCNYGLCRQIKLKHHSTSVEQLNINLLKNSTTIEYWRIITEDTKCQYINCNVLYITYTYV